MNDRFYTRTVTCSVRAEKEWFDKVKETADKLGMNRNQFIVYVVNEYIKNSKSFEDFNNGDNIIKTFNNYIDNHDKEIKEYFDKLRNNYKNE